MPRWNDGSVLSPSEIEHMTEGFLACGLWTDAIPLVSDPSHPDYCDSGDWESGGMNDSHTIVSGKEDARALCAAFADTVALTIDAYAELRGSWEAVGHDLWLSLAGHGTGFWDRGSLYSQSRDDRLLARLGARMNDHCDRFGSETGEIYENGPESAQYESPMRFRGSR